VKSPRISGFIIALVLISLTASIMGYFVSTMGTSYDIEYDNESIDVYNRLDELKTQAEEVQNKTNIESESGILDILGKYFSGGYKALKLSGKSFDTFNVLATQGINDLNLGYIGESIKIALMTIVIVMIFIGVIIRVIVKMDV